MGRRSLFDRLASPRLAAVLIAILLVGTVVSFLVPQRNKPQLTLYEQWSARNPVVADVTGALGLDDVFASPAMLVVYGLLAVNLTACTLRRLSRRRKRRIVVPRPPSHARIVPLPSTVSAQEAVQRAVAHPPPGWRTCAAEDGGTGFVIDGGSLGFAGSMIMHFGLILLLLGGLVSAMTRFSGEMALTVGQALPDTAASYETPPKEPPIGTGYREGTVGLQALRFEYEEGKIVTAEALMEFVDRDGPQVQKVRVNEPARWQGKSFLLFGGGHAAVISVSDADGTLLLDGVVRLGDRVDGGYSDEVELPDSRRLRIRTVADAADPEVSDTEVMALRDPRVTVALAGQESVASKPLGAGESVELGDVRVTVGEVTLWNTFLVRSDGGIPVSYLSFALIILGVTVRLVFPNRLVAVRVDDDDDGAAIVSVWGRHKSATEEKVVERIGASLGREESA